MPTTREQFEQWAKTVGYDLRREGDEYHYWSGQTRTAWLAFQAATEAAAERERVLRKACEAAHSLLGSGVLSHERIQEVFTKLNKAIAATETTT